MNEIRLPRHVVATASGSIFLYDRCGQAGCGVAPTGLASRCGAEACPGCGTGGANVGEGSGTATCSICGTVWAALLEAELQATG